jgi:hypothetical protein
MRFAARGATKGAAWPAETRGIAAPAPPRFSHRARFDFTANRPTRRRPGG